MSRFYRRALGMILVSIAAYHYFQLWGVLVVTGVYIYNE